MQFQDVFTFKDYKSYINKCLDHGLAGRGARSRFARAIQCQAAYVSSVLRGHQHFTMEQAELINIYFKHNDLEAEYFLLLLQLQKAGNIPLKNRLQKNIDRILKERFDLKHRLNVPNTISEQDQIRYFSEWYYAAIHVCTSLPFIKTEDQIAHYLHLPEPIVINALLFLTQIGVIQKTKNGYESGVARLHLGSDSPLITRHHANWRLFTLQHLPIKKEEDTHYSSVVTLSESDFIKIKEQLILWLQSTKELIKNSKEETVCCLNLDFFKI